MQNASINVAPEDHRDMSLPKGVTPLDESQLDEKIKQYI